MTLLSIFTTPLGSCVELYRRRRDGQYFVIHTEPDAGRDQVYRYARRSDARAGFDRVVRSVRLPEPSRCRPSPTPEVPMVDDRLQIGGAVVFWRLAKSTNRKEVKAGLRNLALEAYTPEPRSPLACLRAVLPNVYPAQKRTRQTVRPIKANGSAKGFAVVRERPEEARAGDAWGEVVATAALDDKETLCLDPFDLDNEERIRAGMRSAAQWLTSASVGSALVKLVEEHCDGVALRPSGGVYWVREDRLDEWTRIADVFERASARGDSDGKPARPNAIYVLKVVADEQMIRAVGDALTTEVAVELAQIEQDVARGDLKQQACLSRLKRVGNLESKVKRYETAFASPLDKLRDAVQRASVAVAQATLQSSASAIA